MAKLPVQEVLNLPSPEFVEYLKKLADKIKKYSKPPITSGVRDRIRIIKDAAAHATEEILDSKSDLGELFEKIWQSCFGLESALQNKFYSRLDEYFGEIYQNSREIIRHLDRIERDEDKIHDLVKDLKKAV
ncbi:hypothetical protein HOK51_10020 [Candidatus Woesearchaeota archaeon]|jgi:hypothetical protein|nr:hypothetical protein [Candidatus Woesearchaeota archaeon]MBT6520160.1 hypothetical protein [Candidatus Woesearchaeota archaeon]MBT7366765.1 hypothetical protein [Candidatus Woesearchaeota archaeon]